MAGLLCQAKQPGFAGLEKQLGPELPITKPKARWSSYLLLRGKLHQAKVLAINLFSQHAQTCLLSWHSRRFQARPGSFLPVTVSSTVSFQFSAGIWRQRHNRIFYDICSVQEQGKGSRGSDSTRDLSQRDLGNHKHLCKCVYHDVTIFPLCRLLLQPNLL